jgi:preprotein translocase YajC subunit
MTARRERFEPANAALARCGARLYDFWLVFQNRPERAVFPGPFSIGRVPLSPAGHSVRKLRAIPLDIATLVDLLPLLAQQEKGGNGGPASSLWFQLWPFLIIGVLFYFMLIAPERRKRKEMEQLLANIKKNDQVVTIGGICGTVVNASPGSAVVTLRVDDGNNTKIKVLRSAISRVGSPEEETSDAKEST